MNIFTKKHNALLTVLMLFICSITAVVEAPDAEVRSHREDKHSKNDCCCNPNQADFIIIGGGTAGSILARRLSEDHSVILLEGGINDDNNPLIMDPLAIPVLTNGFTNRFFWMYGHAREDQFPDNKRLPAIAGQLLGGGSSVNNTLYVRGTNNFYNNWESIAGDSAWGPTNALNVFKASEDFNGVPGQFDPAQHGENGPIDIRQATTNQEASVVFRDNVIAAFNSMVLPPLQVGVITDYNDFNTPLGAAVYSQLYQQPNKKRESMSTAYLQDILVKKDDNTFVSKNGNLIVKTSARVLNVTFADKKKRKPKANGVRAVIDGCPVKFCAKKKVIISTGFYSPTLLEHSGIGSAKRLKNLGIPVVVDNPNVGENVLNHPILALTGLGTVPEASNPDPEAQVAGIAQLPDPSDVVTPGTRGLQLIGVALPNPTIPEQGAFVVVSFLWAAESTGCIHAIYSDPLRAAEFDFNYMTQETDVQTGIASYKIMFQTLVNMGLTPQGPNPADPDGEMKVREFVLARYGQANHWSSSCRMAQSAKDGVVDSDGNVFGVKNLIVADLQIVPVSPDANTAAAASLVGNVIANKLLC